MNVNRTDIGSNIRAYRNLAGITQSELADKLKDSGITRDQIAKYESGKAIPPLEKTIAIAKALNVVAADLMREHRAIKADSADIYDMADEWKLQELLLRTLGYELETESELPDILSDKSDPLGGTPYWVLVGHGKRADVPASEMILAADQTKKYFEFLLNKLIENYGR